MGKIAQVIYAADFISEDRDFEGLDEIRIEIESDFELGLYLITTHIMKYQLERKNFIHPYSNDFRNKLLKEK
jgi:HD superfamily phosphohydrolase YqeK